MRSSSLLLLIVAACGGSTDSGAFLTIRAPDGPGAAARIDIVLANARMDSIVSVDDQRTRAGDLAQQTATYYRQRAIAGSVGGIDRVDGFQIRLEPNQELVAEQELIPFLIAYDAGDRVIGIGTFVDPADPASSVDHPSSIEIRADLLRVYDITMVPMAQVTGEAGIARREVLPVRCQSFDSGLAFQPADTQLRLLFADTSRDPAATDARDRALDLDCDAAEAGRDDCDDLRGEFHAGAIEACDGMDYDCDFRRFEMITCNGLTTPCGETEGYQLCADVSGGQPHGACTAAPECGCQNAVCGGAHCKLGFVAADGIPAKTMCDPQTAVVAVPGCAGACTVEVVQRSTDAFFADIAFENTTEFKGKLAGVTDKLQLRVRHVGLSPITAGLGEAVGSVMLVIIPDATSIPRLLGIALLLETGAEQTCEPAGSIMTCAMDG